MLGFFAQTIVRRRAPATEDQWGNEARNWDAAVDTPIVGVNVQPNAQDEDDGVLRTITVTSWRVQSAPGVDLDLVHTDRIVFDGIVCDVIGEVARWPDPVSGGVHHVELTIKRWEG